jgi:hypothetical protein
MSERRWNDADRALARDLRALRSTTDRDLLAPEDTARALAAEAAGAAARPIEEDFWMKRRRMLSARPGLATAGALVIAAAVLGIVPISFERTTGHDVRLALAGGAPDPSSLGRIASEFKNAVGAPDVRVAAALGPEGPATMLAASVPARSRSGVERTAQAFASALTARGIPASATVAARKERVASNVYALAMARVIELNIRRAGRSPAEIEADIRGQLEAAGLQDPQVQVTKDGDQTTVQIQEQCNEPGEERQIQVKLHADGEDPANTRMHQFQVERRPGMTDADIKAEIERQMREAGVEGTVEVQNGEIRVHVEKHPQQ